MKLVTSIALVLMMATGAAYSQVNWTAIQGPVSTPNSPYNSASTFNHVGSDGNSLYVVFNDNSFYKYNAGAWTKLATPTRNVNGGDSYGDMAYQNGYLYTSAIPSGVGGRTITRYSIANNSWEVWTDSATGKDINSCNISHGIFMDPTQDGVGYAAWHAGGWIVKFDWNVKTTGATAADNNWMGSRTITDATVLDKSWVSRNEDFATNGTGTYYGTHNDKTVGISGGDIIYTWTGMAKGTVPTVLTTKPWQSGFGQSIEFVSGSMTASGHDELWMIRGDDATAVSGTDTAYGPREGFGNPTSDWGIYDLATGQWTLGTLPGAVGSTGEIVRAGNSMFVRGINDQWYVASTVPEPGSLLAMMSGLVGLGGFAWRRRK